MTLFIDLDGPILDVSERSYQAYKDILKKKNKQYLSKTNYLRMKREKLSIEVILKKTDAEDFVPYFKRKWKKEIEKPYYLSLDKLSWEIKKTLSWLKNHYSLVLITLRRHPRRLFKQLKEKDIRNIVDYVLIASSGNNHEKWRLKYKLIRKNGNYDKNSIIIGDTETDILAGKKLRIKTIAVTSGMRSREFLKKIKPDFIIKDLSMLKNVFCRLKKAI